MIPTRETTIERIATLPEADYKKVAIYVQSVIQDEKTADDAEVQSLMDKFNKKYEKAFRALGQ